MANQFREAMKRMAQQIQSSGGGSGGGGGGGGGAGRAAAALASSVTALATAGVLGYGAFHSIYTVQGGHRAVVFNRVVGMKDTVYGEGLNFNIPWFERPIIYDIRTRPVNLQTLTGSKDLQMVTIAIRVLHKPNPNQLVWIYRYLGQNYDERVLPSIMNECAKAVVARYNASELLTRRDVVSREISNELKLRAGNFNILLEVCDISLDTFTWELLMRALRVSFSALQAGIISHFLFFVKYVGCCHYAFGLFARICQGCRSQTGRTTGCRTCQVHCDWGTTGKEDHYHQGARRSRISHSYWYSSEKKPRIYEASSY